jgi:hypothetical protein
MAAHEFGVHVVPYMDELLLYGGKPRDDEKIDASKQPGPRGKTDHLRVANVAHEDFTLYRTVVIDMMNALIEANGKKEGTAIAQSLADAYLMDISTFLQSGGRVVLPFAPNAIAEKYNSYAKEKPHLPVRVPKKTRKNVLTDYARLYGNVLPVAAKQHRRGLAKIIAAVVALCLIYFVITRLAF